MKGLGYYEAVAQIIPLLSIVAAWQAGFLPWYRGVRRHMPWWGRAVFVLPFLLAAWAEIAALGVLHEEKENGWAENITWIGMSSLVLVIIYWSFPPDPREWGVERKPPRESKTSADREAD